MPFPFVSIGGFPYRGFFDKVRQLLFATNPELNELDVIAQNDLSIKARISLPAAWGIDQMPDGKTLVVGTDAQEIYTVDEDTYAVTRYPVPHLGISQSPLFYPNLLAMANGKVLLVGQEQNVDSEDIINAGQFLIEWDSKTDTFSQLTANGTPIPADSLARSGDHKWAAFGYGAMFLYSSDSDSLTQIPAATVNPNSANVYYALNGDGSKIAFVADQQVIFTDRSFNLLGSVAISDVSGDVGSNRAEFSPDGSRLFYSDSNGVLAVDATSYTSSGFYTLGISDSAYAEPVLDMTFLDVDTNGRVYFGTDNGIRYTDTAGAPTPWPPGTNSPGFGCAVPTPNYFPLNSASQVSFGPGGGVAYGTQVYLGTYPATVPSSGVEYSVFIPASSVAGPVGEECVGPSGITDVILNAISYGVQVAAPSANLLPANETPTIDIFGYGILDSTFNSTPAITVGGSSAHLVTTNATPYTDSLQGASITVPKGIPGSVADLKVTSANGTGTLANAVTYLPETTIVPGTELLGLIYDTHRSLVYALKAHEVDVLDPATLTWKTPLTLPGAASNLSYADFALSPDGARMVLAAADQHLVVLSPDSPAAATVLPYTCNPGQYSTTSVAITSSNVAVLNGPCAISINLSTLSIQPMTFSGIIRTSTDGTHLCGVNGSAVSSIDNSTLVTTLAEGIANTLPFSDVAVSPDGSHCAAIIAPPLAVGDIIAFFDAGLRYSYANVYPPMSPPTSTGVIGASYSPGGKVLALPLGDSVELWDASTGTLRARMMTAEPLNPFAYPETSAAAQIAFDPTGQYLYAISASGLTAFEFPVPVDQIASAHWPPAMIPNSIHSIVNGLPATRLAALRRRFQGVVTERDSSTRKVP